jgi:hypothetical protein
MMLVMMMRKVVLSVAQDNSCANLGQPGPVAMPMIVRGLSFAKELQSEE